MVFITLILFVSLVWHYEQREAWANASSFVILFWGLAVSFLPKEAFGKNNWEYAAMGLVIFSTIYGITQG